jgi:NADPH:quinone reductase
MIVVGVTEFGGPDKLRMFELPTPEAAPGQVRIRVHAAAVNPTDTITRAGLRVGQVDPPPPVWVPGMDVAGVVDQIGEGTVFDAAVGPLEVGDRVMAIVVPSGSYGGYAEYVVVPAESVVKAPAGSSHAEAASIPMNGLTARLALDLMKLTEGQTLLVTGAAGAFGGYVVQLAKADGLRVIADASAADTELVRGLGADVVLARGNDLAERVLALEPDGVAGCADGALLHAAVLPAIRYHGDLAAVRGFAGETERSIEIHSVWVREYAKERAKLDKIRQQVEAGQVTMRVARSFPTAEAHEAHRLLEAGGTRGRLIIEFSLGAIYSIVS